MKPRHKNTILHFLVVLLGDRKSCVFKALKDEGKEGNIGFPISHPHFGMLGLLNMAYTVYVTKEEVWNSS